MYFLRLLIFFNLLLMLAACSSTTGPVNIRDAYPPSHVPSSASLPKAPSDDPSVEQRTALVSPVSPEYSKKVIPSVEKLINESSEQLAAKHYQQAIASAERGLRMDRKEPRFYLLLAQSYRYLKQTAQSTYFARQGLRYAQKNSVTYEKLSRLAKSK